MLICNALLSHIFLIFEILIFAECYDKIERYDLHYEDNGTLKMISYDNVSRKAVEFSTRIVMDLLQKTYLDKGVVFTSGNRDLFFGTEKFVMYSYRIITLNDLIISHKYK